MVWETWAPEVEGSITYYSEEESMKYSTVDIGVPNTESGMPRDHTSLCPSQHGNASAITIGHCGKALAIIKKAYADSASGRGLAKWLVIADDDTLLRS